MDPLSFRAGPTIAEARTRIGKNARLEFENMIKFSRKMEPGISKLGMIDINPTVGPHPTCAGNINAGAI
jgi:hypothetical protein